MPHNPEKHPERFRWIVDGHNVIFASPDLSGLQLSGDRTGARRDLEQQLESFGRAAGLQVWVVFDGNEDPRNPEVWDRPHLRTFYSGIGEEADDRICLLALQCQQKGESVVVVTSDRRTLGVQLPASARVVAADRFLRTLRIRTRAPEKWMGESLADVERHFLAQSPFAEDRALAQDLPKEDEEGDDDSEGPRT